MTENNAAQPAPLEDKPPGEKGGIAGVDSKEPNTSQADPKEKGLEEDSKIG